MINLYFDVTKAKGDIRVGPLQGNIKMIIKAYLDYFSISNEAINYDVISIMKECNNCYTMVTVNQEN